MTRVVSPIMPGRQLGVLAKTKYKVFILLSPCEIALRFFFFQFYYYGYYGLHHSNHFCMLSVSMFSVSLRVVMYFHAPFDFVL